MKNKKEEIIRKKDPTTRQNIHLATFKKIKEFLVQQIEPINKSEITRSLGIDYNSVNFALKMLQDEGKLLEDKQGRIYLNKEVKNGV